MPVIESRINPRSQEFQDNARVMRTLVDDLRERIASTAQGGGETARARHLARGKLLPRERVERLLDPGTPFLELSPLAALDVYDNASPGAPEPAHGHHPRPGNRPRPTAGYAHRRRPDPRR